MLPGGPWSGKAGETGEGSPPTRRVRDNPTGWWWPGCYRVARMMWAETGKTNSPFALT